MRDSCDRQTLTSRAPVGYQRSQLCSNYGIMRSNGRGYVKPSALHLTAWVMKPRLLVYVITSPCSSISSRERKLTICDFDMESESIGSNGTGNYWKQAIIMKKKHDKLFTDQMDDWNESIYAATATCFLSHHHQAFISSLSRT
jgi:hypothetical protein